MTIRKVEVDEYAGGKLVEGKVTVSEFAGRCILTIRNEDGSYSRAEVYFDDLQRAWQAVKR